jgi:hypothetical protein
MAISLTDTNSVETAVRKFAKERNLGPGEALERLAMTGLRRVAAVTKYTSTHTPKLKAKPAKVAAKAPKAKKAA